MTRSIDIDSWPRRAAFEFFRGYDNPYFNVCVQIDVTELVQLCRSAPDLPFSLASLYLALRGANECEPFRYRLRGSEVIVHDRLHVGTTHLLPDQRLAFIYFDYAERFADFVDGARTARLAAESMTDQIDAQEERTDLIHFSSLPWIAFTSFSHARNWGSGDSVPKITFGRYGEVDGRIRMPLSVEVHHALMDGVHVGQYLERLEGLLANPASLLI